jgi:Tol biopolymer transport system component
MCRVICRGLGLVGTMLLLAAMPGAAGAVVPDGPRFAVIKSDGASSRTELTAMGLSGEGFRVLAATLPGGNTELQGFSWSGDGATIAFSKAFGLRDQAIYTVSAEGGKPKLVLGTKNGFRPVFSPDGQTIAFSRPRIRFGKKGERFLRFVSTSVWLVNAGGGRPIRLTPWRDRLLLSPSSFSPDGSTLALSRTSLNGKTLAAIGLRLADRSTYSIAKGSAEPVFSPDGSRIALMRARPRKDVPRFLRGLAFGSDVFIAQADGSGTRRLTHSPNILKTSLSWDPTGERLLYTRFGSKLTFAALIGIGNSVIEVNADGTCRHRLLHEPGASYLAAAWQPGPGREAGRISC